MSAVQRPALAALSFLALVTFTVFAVNRNATMATADRPDQWKKVQEAENKGLPKTAIQEVDLIIESALKDKAYPEAVKAIAKKITLEGQIEGNKAEEKITRLQAEIAKAPKEMVPVMDAILAHWYWHYFQQNRYRFVQRTATSAPPGKDFTTWDLPRLFDEIDSHFAKALSAEKDLKATPIAAFDGLLDKGTLPDVYRPTLFDFLAFEALTFYSSPEQAGAKAEDDFEIAAGSPAMAPTEEFVKWNPVTTDTASRKLKAIKLYQSLLAYHADDQDKTALHDADLQRLQFGYNAAVGEEKSTLYKTALKRFADTHAGHELSATARYRLAAVIQGEGDRVEAKKIAQQAVDAYPNSVGGKLAYNLIRQIEAKELNVATERVWAEPRPAIRVTYRNFTKLHFRAYSADWVSRLDAAKRYRPENITDADRKAFLAKKPDYEFAVEMPETPDYQSHSHDVPVPAGWKPGYYLLFVSPDAAFPEQNVPMMATDIWVSDLALVIRTEGGDASLDGFVLKGKTGEPIAGARVKSWVRNQQGRYVAGPEVATNDNGLFKIAGAQNQSYLLLATAGDQQLASGNEFYLYANPRQPNRSAQTVFFTDRSIYRPGQTIQFKGICLLADQDQDNYTVVPNKALTVVFNDVNGQPITKVQVKTNDYGSFNGSVTAPRDRLTGRMQLTIESDAPGSTQVTVEEYKRPQFQVTIEAPKTQAKLAGDVTVTGKATAYTGAAIGGAKVKYRVTRAVRYPSWCYEFFWWRMPPQGSSQEITHGTATTAADGSFDITFTAKPDLTVPENDEPIFRFHVTADVTDTTGETRSGAKDVQVGYAGLQATVSATAWQVTGTDTKFTVSTQSLDGEGLAAKGTVKIYAVKQPDAVIRTDVLGARSPRMARGGKPLPPKPDPSDPRTWDSGDVVATLPFATDAAGSQFVSAKLPVGIYRAVVETVDRFDKPVTGRMQFQVIDPAAKAFALKLPNHLAAPKWSLEPGSDFTAIWGTGYAEGRAFVEIEHRRRIVQAYWTEPGCTQIAIKQAITEAMRGGFTLRVTSVKENRAFLENHHVDVPWTNKELTITWERFVSKLEPGAKETWTAVIAGPDAKKAVAEMVAALYDASLDQYLPHNWSQKFGVFRQDYSGKQLQFESGARYLNGLTGWWRTDAKNVGPLTYRSFPADLTQNVWRQDYRMLRAGATGMPTAPGAALESAPAGRYDNANAALRKAGDADALGDENSDVSVLSTNIKGALKGFAKGPGPDLSKIAARTNLNETAFFFPHVLADDTGTVRLVFTMPEALTKWKFLGFAHDKTLRSGFLGGETVTAKDLMVRPNPPRFLREGDTVEFTVKVNNQSAEKQTGKVRLTFTDARTGAPVDAALGLPAGDQAFDIAPKEAATFAWRLTVPDGLGPITYKAVAAAAKFSDGEEAVIPVLSKRVLVTESLALPIRGKQSKTFDFAKLKDSANSNTLKHQSLTVQMCSQPAWYAVMALPYLMEYEHECAEQSFNRLYANALARHVAASDPKIRKVFDQWKNTPALDSPLEKNQDLKSVLLAETPWVRDAKDESQARRNVGILFDDNRLNAETARLMKRLAELQYADGAWPWFPGGPSNDYITLYITTGYGRLRHLGVPIDVAPAIKAVNRLDAMADRIYREILKHAVDKDKNHLSTTIALYLYCRSFFLKDQPIAKEYQEANAYWLGQAKKYWLPLGNRQSQAHLALALQRFGDRVTPTGIVNSLRERAVTNEEMGMFWRDTEYSWWWYHAPIESQAMMIEAFAEVAEDAKSVEDCKVWLLKQKQTQNWKTTKGTADAVYALMLRGENLLKSDALVEVKLGGQAIKPVKVEAGTGFYQEKFLRTEVKPEMGTVQVTKTDDGVAWGSLTWQYLEDVSKVTPHEGTPLKLEKKLFIKTLTKAGPKLDPVTGPLVVGDELVVRLVLRTDRDMEYVHLKDQRGSGTEPVNVLSRYRFQDGLAYYESTKDTASHFFIDYLPKGTYVFEYSVRVQLKGKYPTGLADIQCMYAPEFNSHSESIALEVK